jgi:hypothetical protein
VEGFMKDPSMIPLTIIKDVKEQDFEVAEDLYRMSEYKQYS